MKILKTYILSMLFLSLAACSQDVDDNAVEVKGDKMNVSVSVAVPTWTDMGTRAGVSPADIGIADGSMQMLCFDKNGYYLGMGEQPALTPADSYNGKMVAKVPSSTCRIHFIANADITENAEWIGMYENTLIASLPTATVGDKMVYWGYVRKDTPAELAAFVENSSNTVYMLRNEAKVSVKNSDSKISAVSLTVCGDADRGTLAPFDYSNLSAPFTYDTSTGIDFATIPADAAARTTPTTIGNDTEQFIFESTNTVERPVSAILKTTYTNGIVRYHKIHLLTSKYRYYSIQRNHNYQINIKQLEQTLGYDSFDKAVEGTPSNNSLIDIDDIVPSVTDYADRTLAITDASGNTASTSVVYNTTGTKTVYFTYTGDATMTASDFYVAWLENDGVSPEGGISVSSYNASTGRGAITFNVNSVSEEMLKGKFTLLDTKHGLRRNVKIYAVSPFEFKASLIKGEIGGSGATNYVLKSTTGIKYSTTGNKTISFTFSGDNSMSASDFSVSASGGEYVSSDIKNTSISYSNGKGTISFYLNYVSSSASIYYHYTLTLTDTKHNTKVEILICTNSGTTHTHTETEVSSSSSVSTSSDDVYTLQFTVPDNYPEDLMPVTVKIATNDFNAKSPQLGVVVEETQTITGKDWNFWYEYSATTTGMHTITLSKSRTSSTGNELWLNADYFTPQKITFSY